jgi:hypothetical protein
MGLVAAGVDSEQNADAGLRVMLLAGLDWSAAKRRRGWRRVGR